MPPSVPISAVSVIIRDFTLLRCLRRQKNHPPIARASTRTPATTIPAIAGPPRCSLLIVFSSVEGPLPSGERDVDVLLLFAELKASESVIEPKSLSEPIDEAIDVISDDTPPMADVICAIVEAIGGVMRTVDEVIDSVSVSRAGNVVMNAILDSVGGAGGEVAVPADKWTVEVESCRLTHDTQSKNMCWNGIAAERRNTFKC